MPDKAKPAPESEVDGVNTENVGNVSVETQSSKKVDDIVSSIYETRPDVQQHAIDAEMAKQAEIAQMYSEYTDRRKRPFDPSIHETKADGSPVLTPSGYIKIRKTPKPTSSTNSSSFVAQPDSAQETPSASVKARVSGVAAANLMITTSMILGGEEFKPIKNDEYGIDEKKHLEMAFSDYFEAKELQDIPPGVALSVAILAYITPRFTLPKTQSRLVKMKAWIWKWWQNRKLAREGRAANKDVDTKKSSSD